MSYQISTLLQTLEVTNVTNVAVTTITSDTEAGDYYREIRIMAVEKEGAAEGVVATLRIRGATADDIEIDVPASQF